MTKLIIYLVFKTTKFVCKLIKIYKINLKKKTENLVKNKIKKKINHNKKIIFKTTKH